MDNHPEFRVIPFRLELFKDLLYLLRRCFKRQNFDEDRTRDFILKGYGMRNHTFLVYWNDIPVGHYSLVTYPLYINGKPSIGGIPESECIDPGFFVMCAREKINYRNLNPLSMLYQEVEKAAEQEGAVILHHFFPSMSALATLRNSDYATVALDMTYYFWVENAQTLVSRHITYSGLVGTQLRKLLRMLPWNLTSHKYYFDEDDARALEILENDWLNYRDHFKISFSRSADYLKSLFASEKYRKLIVKNRHGEPEGAVLLLREGRIVRVLLWSIPQAINAQVFKSLAHYLRQQTTFLPDGFDHLEVIDIENRSGLDNSKMLINGFVSMRRKEYFCYLVNNALLGTGEFDIKEDLDICLLLSDRIFDFS